MSANYSKARKNPSKRNEFFKHILITSHFGKKFKNLAKMQIFPAKIKVKKNPSKRKEFLLK